jgi:TolB protein
VNANYLAFGYTAEQNGQIVLFGWFYDVLQADVENAEIIGKIYFGSLDEAGAVKVARDFAADILALVGVQSLAGTKIYFVSQRGQTKEIWSMDYDGSNQKQVTNLRDISRDPALSYDNSRLAFTTFAGGNPSIMLLSTETGRQMPFYNQRASLNHTPEFMPDGRIMFSSTAAGGAPQLYMADQDGSNLRRITHTNAIEVSPKVNPKNPRQIVFVSGRSGLPQIYIMNIDGTDVERLTSGEGEAVQPSWSPSGEYVAFSWTRGFAPGNYNVFIMNVAKREYVQLTHGQGRNENPSWARDGRRLVFSSNRSGSSQIWTMLADGNQTRQLTTQGRNENPVWSR